MRLCPRRVLSLEDQCDTVTALCFSRDGAAKTLIRIEALFLNCSRQQPPTLTFAIYSPMLGSVEEPKKTGALLIAASPDRGGCGCAARRSNARQR